MGMGNNLEGMGMTAIPMGINPIDDRTVCYRIQRFVLRLGGNILGQRSPL